MAILKKDGLGHRLLIFSHYDQQLTSLKLNQLNLLLPILHLKNLLNLSSFFYYNYGLVKFLLPIYQVLNCIFLYSFTPTGNLHIT